MFSLLGKPFSFIYRNLVVIPDAGSYLYTIYNYEGFLNSLENEQKSSGLTTMTFTLLHLILTLFEVQFPYSKCTKMALRDMVWW